MDIVEINYFVSLIPTSYENKILREMRREIRLTMVFLWQEKYL